MSRGTVAHVSPAALQHNLSRVREIVPDQLVMAVVKSDAYGHGLALAADALSSADAFAVAFVDEAITLRKTVPDKPILILQGCHEAAELDLVDQYRLWVVVHREEQLFWIENARLSMPVCIWIKLNTGMNRLGFPPDQLAAIYQKAANLKNVSKITVMSHFACADLEDHPQNHIQTVSFCEATNGMAVDTSLSNSAAIVRLPNLPQTWVRPGIMLYGSSPSATMTASSLKLMPAMSLKAPIIAIHSPLVGEGFVGYGGTWQGSLQAKVGVVAIGYGDGYPRAASNRASVMVNGVECGVVGRVSMDMITVDLSEVDNVQVGDWVECWGEQLCVDKLAQRLDTISYELFCQLTSRVPRIASEVLGL